MTQMISRASVALGAVVTAGLFAFALLAALRDDPPPVYLSIGDGTQMGYGVAPGAAASAIFRQYLSDEFDEPVLWATTANGDYVTTASFIDFGQTQSQLELAEARLHAYRAEGRRVAVITLSIGGNDLVEVGRQCASPPCGELYARLRDQMLTSLNEIYTRINQAKDPSTPLLVLLYYNASDCGQAGVETSPTELGVIGWNTGIRETAERHGAFLVDAYTPIRGNACRYINNLDLNEEGNQLLAAQYRSVYEALPDEFR